MTVTIDETEVRPLAVGTMKAAVVKSFTEPLEIEHLPRGRDGTDAGSAPHRTVSP